MLSRLFKDKHKNIVGVNGTRVELLEVEHSIAETIANIRNIGDIMIKNIVFRNAVETATFENNRERIFTNLERVVCRPLTNTTDVFCVICETVIRNSVGDISPDAVEITKWVYKTVISKAKCMIELMKRNLDIEYKCNQVAVEYIKMLIANMI